MFGTSIPAVGRALLAAICAILAHGSLCRAQDAANGPTPAVDARADPAGVAAGPHPEAPAKKGTDPESPPATIRTARYDSAHADRVLLSPTAATHPQGTFYFSFYEGIIPQVGYAITDRTQISIAGFSDFSESILSDFTVKSNVYRGRAVRIAVQSSINLVAVDKQQLLLGRVGGTLQWCFEVACYSSLSMSAMALIHDEPDLFLPLGAALGLTVRVNDVASLLLEYSGLFNASEDIGIAAFPTFLVSYGVRVAGSPKWALDLALLREMENFERAELPDSDVFALLGYPFVAFSFRFGKAL